VKVLCIVGGEKKPSMGYIYEATVLRKLLPKALGIKKRIRKWHLSLLMQGGNANFINLCMQLDIS